jgi:hypothetical protein
MRNPTNSSVGIPTHPATCKAMTVKGLRCKRVPANREPYCWAHAQGMKHRLKAVNETFKRIAVLTTRSILGIATLVGGVVLLARLSATATSTTNLDNVLGSTKFTITNDGYFKVTDVSASCFIWRVRAGPFRIDDNLAKNVSPPNFELPPTEGFTVPCTPTGVSLAGAEPPHDPIYLSEADVAIVVYYRTWPLIFYRTRRLFRFRASFDQALQVNWGKQPAKPLESDFDALLLNLGGNFPPKPKM